MTNVGVRPQYVEVSQASATKQVAFFTSLLDGRSDEPITRYQPLSAGAPDDQAVWDRIAAVRTGVRGPFGVLMHVPALAERVAALEDYFRFNAALPTVDRELVIMATAREMAARYPWARHEARGREVGTTTEAIEAVRLNGTLEQLTARERLLVEIVRTLLRTHALPDALYTRALAELGRQELIETVALAGHYSLIGLTVNAFEVAPPDDSSTF